MVVKNWYEMGVSTQDFCPNCGVKLNDS